MKTGQVIRIRPEMQYLNENGINVIINSQEEGYMPIDEAYISFNPALDVKRLLKKMQNESYNVKIIGKQGNVWVLSKKEYIGEEINKMQVGQVVEGVIKEVTPKSAFVKLRNEVEVYIPIIEMSATKFDDLTRVFFKGQKTKIKIIKKEGLFVWGSRKQAYQIINTTFPIDSYVYVIITECGKDAFENAMFSEVTPNLSGVLNVPEKIKKNLLSGDIVKAKIISYGKRGDFKLKFVAKR